ncbi:MAG: hypothetical protein REJ23_14205, partial [Brevundimonas sp.]|nr:hypothetical protein [Brevundimonas sp.]
TRTPPPTAAAGGSSRPPSQPDASADSPPLTDKQLRQELRNAQRNANALQALERIRQDRALERRLEKEHPFALAYGVSMATPPTPLGVECANPRLLPRHPLALGEGFSPDDTPSADPEVQRREAAETGARRRAAVTRNQQIIRRADFPYPDLCRARTEQEPRLAGDALSGITPVRAVTGPARDLHDAARRGSEAEVRMWLDRTDWVDAPDAFGLTPLAWAIIRNRPGIADLLRDEGAGVLAGPDGHGEHSPAWFAARTGNLHILRDFRASPGKAGRAPVPLWPASVLQAALLSGSEETVRQIVIEGVEPLDPDRFQAWLNAHPSAAALFRDRYRQRLGMPAASSRFDTPEG